MDMNAWLRRWLSRHPMHEPRVSPSEFTRHVMTRVRAIHDPQPVRERSRSIGLLPWGRLGLVAAGLTAIVVFGLHQSTSDLAHTDLVVDELAQEMELMDTLVLAETMPNEEETWVEETLSLLNALEEEPADDLLEPTDDSWMDELQLIDESDLTST